MLEKLPLLALGGVSAVLTVKAQASGGSVQSLIRFPLWLRVENAIVSYARYLGKFCWPSPLAPLYPFSRTAPPVWQFLTAMAVLVAISAVVLVERRRRYLVTGWLWFLGALVPMIGLVQVGVQAMADRYAYLSFIGLFVMFSWGAAELAETRHLRRAWTATAAVAVLLALALTTRHQLAYWADETDLWTHTIAVTPPNYLAQDNLGTALMMQQRMEDAIVHFRRAAAALEPSDPLAELNIGFYEQGNQRWREAIAAYRSAIAKTENIDVMAKAYSNLGYAYCYVGEMENAGASFRRAVELAPDTSQAWVGLGRRGPEIGRYGSGHRRLHPRPSLATLRPGISAAGEGAASKWTQSGSRSGARNRPQRTRKFCRHAANCGRSRRALSREVAWPSEA